MNWGCFFFNQGCAEGEDPIWEQVTPWNDDAGLFGIEWNEVGGEDFWTQVTPWNDEWLTYGEFPWEDFTPWNDEAGFLGIDEGIWQDVDWDQFGQGVADVSGQDWLSDILGSFTTKPSEWFSGTGEGVANFVNNVAKSPILWLIVIVWGITKTTKVQYRKGYRRNVPRKATYKNYYRKQK